ncbi:type 4 pilus major pilin [Methylophilus sp. QUAN]|uniref:type 4 pilus major pilin n=1 Tax=Methylophilus sp. QUAN TaxID=2781020 RepID=UPI00188F19AA|nr:type 4 pilus major pilin [Methylophilus sp. QUAN]MBF4990972.1 prepilin-type N-terminal cleavage/methylation domain-containing protein [Methylophilus sp. QUAN]
MIKNIKSKYQAGVTLLELIISLTIMAVIIVGALKLNNSASSTNNSTQLTTDIASIRAAVKNMWSGQQSYGTSGTNLNTILVTAKRIPTSITVDTSATPNVLTHQLNGTIVVASTGTSFNVTVTNIPVDVCIPLVTGAQGWTSVQAGSAAARTTFPIPTATAAADCDTGTTLVFTN